MDTSNLLDLDYASKNAPAPTFDVLKDESPEDTWARVFRDVKAALVARGHNCGTKVRGLEKVRFSIVLASMYHSFGKPAFDDTQDSVGGCCTSQPWIIDLGILLSFCLCSAPGFAARRCSLEADRSGMQESWRAYLIAEARQRREAKEHGIRQGTSNPSLLDCWVIERDTFALHRV